MISTKAKINQKLSVMIDRIDASGYADIAESVAFFSVGNNETANFIPRVIPKIIKKITMIIFIIVSISLSIFLKFTSNEIYNNEVLVNTFTEIMIVSITPITHIII